MRMPDSFEHLDLTVDLQRSGLIVDIAFLDQLYGNLLAPPGVKASQRAISLALRMTLLHTFASVLQA